MPTYQAIIVSSLAFGGAHLTAKDLPHLIVVRQGHDPVLWVYHACQWCYSCVWSFMYVRSRNLATPMLMHSMWNSTVLAFFTLLTAMGIDVKQIL